MDLSPRRIWFGITIPGKKMLKVVAGHHAAWDRGEILLDNYSEGPREALTTAALTLAELQLHDVPGDALGPAGRNLLSRSFLSAKQLMFGGVIDAMNTATAIAARIPKPSPAGYPYLGA